MKIPDYESLKDLKPKVILATLEKLVEALDDKDSEDFFGTEGWRRFLGFGD